MSPHDPTPAPHSPEWCAIVDAAAAGALADAMAGDLDAAARGLSAASALGGAPFDRMMLCWTDTMLRYLGFPDEIPADALVQLGFCEPDGLTPIDLDDVPPAKRWAGRFMAARAADDHATVAALAHLHVGESYPERIIAVLTGAAATLRNVALRDSTEVPIP